MKCSSNIEYLPSDAKMWKMTVTEGIYFCLKVQSVILWQPHCDFRVVRTTTYLKAIKEIYGEIIYRSGYKEEYKASFVGYLGCYVRDILYVFNTLFCFH